MHSMLHALLEGSAYFEPAMQPYADPKQVEQAVRGTNARYVEPKIVVLERLPSGETSAGPTAQQIYQYVRGRRGLVVLVAGQNVTAKGGGLSQEELDDIVQTAARTFDSESYAAGIAQIVRAADQKRGQQIANNWYLALGSGILLAGGVYLVMRRNRKRNTARLNEARERACEVSVRLAPQFETLQSEYEYSLLEETDAARVTQLHEHRHAATQAFSYATNTLDEAQSAGEFEAALAALQTAETTMKRARNALQSPARNDHVQIPAAQPATQDLLSST